MEESRKKEQTLLHLQLLHHFMLWCLSCCSVHVKVHAVMNTEMTMIACAGSLKSSHHINFSPTMSLTQSLNTFVSTYYSVSWCTIMFFSVIMNWTSVLIFVFSVFLKV